MNKTCVILPLKTFDRAKLRLSSVLSVQQRSALARFMATDVLRTLSAVPEIDDILITGRRPDHAGLAAEFGCAFIEDDPELNVSGNVARAAEHPLAALAGTLVYLPADLPLLTVQDVRALLALHRDGLTVCRALRDGGSNAMLASPPGAASFSFGGNSAARHAAAARRAGWPVRILDIPAFQRDIDEPADLAWLCQYGKAGATVEYLTNAGFNAGLIGEPLAIAAS